MLVDLHAHFPMHVPLSGQVRTHEHARAWWRQRWQGWVVEAISRVFNYQGPGGSPSVTEELMRRGGVRVALSVLYQPFDEMDLDRRYGAPPQPRYFTDILAQRQSVEDYVADRPGEIAIAHSPGELDTLLASDVTVLVHAIEGGFQIGADAAEIRRNVATLAQLGVAYVTVAHLFFRDVATNAPALPFLSDRLYHWAFPEDPAEGLTPLGRELVEAMVDEGVLIDITHMSATSIADVFALLDARDPDRRIPVLATHMACRFGGLEYCLDDATIARVAERGGLLGLIMCEHYVTSGVSGIKKSLSGSLAALYRHIDRIHEVSGGYDHIGVGSDLDGYIKPALPGLQDSSRLAELERGLTARYGPAVAEQICGANALGVLRAQWGRKRPRPGSAP